MTARYPLVLNGTSIEELQSGDSIIGAGLTYDSFTATASQTTFTTSVAYTPNQISVFVSGVRMVNGSDVTVSSGTQVVFGTGLAVGTKVDLVYSA